MNRYLTLAVLSVLAGCYSRALVGPQAVHQLGAGLDGPRRLWGQAGSALLDPQVKVRAHLSAERTTHWFEASALHAAPDGLIFGSGLPVAQVTSATVQGLQPGGLELLRSSAPPGGEVSRSLRLDEGYELKLPRATELLPWAAAFAARAASQGQAAGTWHLARDADLKDVVFGTGAARAVVVDAQQVIDGAGHPQGVFAAGFRWSELQALELSYFNPVDSALTVPLFPLVLLLAWVDSSAVEVESLDPGFSAGPALLWRANERELSPLFTAAARRRAIVKVVASIDTGASVSGDVVMGAALGVRFRNFFEMAGVARELSWSDLSPTGQRSNRLAGGVSFGLHVDGDADPRFALYFATEIVGAGGHTWVRSVSFKWGPRFGLGQLLFVTVAPFNLSNVAGGASADGPEYGKTRFVSTIELGGAL